MNNICEICNSSSELIFRERINGLGINPFKLNKICSKCKEKVDIINDNHPYF